MTSLENKTVIVQGVTSETEVLLPLTIEMEIEVSRRKKKCAISDREGDRIGWFENVHECFNWLTEREIDEFYCDSPSGVWAIKLTHHPTERKLYYG